MSRVATSVKRRDPEGAGFAKVVVWERSQILGRRLAVVVERVMEVIGVGDVARRVLRVERGGTGGSG